MPQTEGRGLQRWESDLSDVCGGAAAVVLWCDGLSAHEDAWIRVTIGIDLHTHTHTHT